MKGVERRDSTAGISVKSLLVAVMRSPCCETGAGTGGSVTSVKVKVMSGDDSSNAAARTCPIKPAAPVIRIASFCDIVRLRVDRVPKSLYES